MTSQEIINTGQTIANETHIGGNTAERVGGVIEGIGQNLTEVQAAIINEDTSLTVSPASVVAFPLYVGVNYYISSDVNAILSTRYTENGPNVETIGTVRDEILFTPTHNTQYLRIGSVAGTSATLTIKSRGSIVRDFVGAKIEQTFTDTEKKQARKNLGLGNGDIDTTPAAESGNVITSGGVYDIVGKTELNITGDSVVPLEMAVGKTYVIINTGTNNTPILSTRSTAAGTNLETIANTISAGNSVEFTPSQACHYLRVGAGNATTLSVFLKLGLQNEVYNLKKRVDTNDASIDELAEKTEILTKAVVYDEVLTDSYIEGKYINTNVAVGNTVNTTPVSNNNFAYIIYPCKQGDVFGITGYGGTASRLWCFTDANYVKLSGSPADIVENDLFLTAPEDGYFISNIALNATYKLGVIFSDNDAQTINEKIDSLINSVDELEGQLYETGKKEVSLNTESGKYIADSGNLAGGGSATDFAVKYVSCAQGDKFVLTYPTNGPSNGSARTYAIYSATDINSASSANVLARGYFTKNVVANEEIEIEVTDSNAKLLCVTQFVAGTYNLTPTLKKVTEVNRLDDIVERIETLEGKTVINVEVEHIGELQDGYINTGSISIGDTVSTTPVTASGWAYLILPTLSGQSFRVKGSGGNNPRLWALCDSDYKLLSRANTTTRTETYIDITADENGYLICNVATAVDFNSVVSLIPEDIDLYVKELNEKIEKGEQKKQNVEVDIKDYTFINDAFIGISGGIGTSDTFGCYVIPCQKGDVFTLYTFKPLGSTVARSYAIYNSEDTFTSSTALTLGQISSNGKIEIEITDDSAKTLIIGWRTVADITLFKVEEKSVFDVIDEELDNEKHDSSKVHFEIGHELKTTNIREVFDFREDNERSDYYGLSGLNSLMFQMQDRMDELMAANTDYITKFDAVTFVGGGLEYPEYANGIETEGTYLVTPRYRTYMYKMSYVNAGVNGKCNRPVKILITGSIHGNEQSASLNLYTIMKEFCNDYLSDINIFKARGAFDLYIVPCVNGYCSIHRARVNANGVNINRNFPTPDWAEQGDSDPTSQNYRGPSAGSEFETQLIMGLINTIKPDIYIDAHSYAAAETLQFYVEMTDKRNVRMAYDCIADVSYTLKKAFPQWFGTGYSMLKGDANTVSSGHAPADSDNSSAKGPVWAYLNGVPFAITLEISGGINYNDGVLDGHDIFAEQVYQIGEYTFMCQLYRYGQYVSNRLISPRYWDN